MKHSETCVILTLQEIKLIRKEIEISQIDCTISAHGDTSTTLSISTMTKTKKQIMEQEIQPRDQI